MFPTPLPPPDETEYVDAAMYMLGVIGLDTAITLLIAIIIGLTLFWLIVPRMRGGGDD